MFIRRALTLNTPEKSSPGKIYITLSLNICKLDFVQFYKKITLLSQIDDNSAAPPSHTSSTYKNTVCRSTGQGLIFSVSTTTDFQCMLTTERGQIPTSKMTEAIIRAGTYTYTYTQTCVMCNNSQCFWRKISCANQIRARRAQWES